MQAKTEVLLSVLAYSFCSGTLVLLNKLILHHLPYPSLVISVQLTAALMFIGIVKFTDKLQVDPIKWKYVKPYLYYTVAFSMGVFCNMKSLSMSNVETIIVFRALSPCIVSLLDALFLGREYPSLQSWAALGLIVLGTYGYASFDVKFQTQGLAAYFWPMAYLLVISFEMAYGKQIIKSVDLKTKSGPVLYTNVSQVNHCCLLNMFSVWKVVHYTRRLTHPFPSSTFLTQLLGLVPMLVFAATNGEYSKFHQDRIDAKPITAAAILFLLLGCVTGTGIGYSGWWCRDKVSATSFTLIGVMNKCLTILLNLVIWDQHAPPGGIASLALCLVGGSLYRQAPMREALATSKDVADQTEDVWDVEQKAPEEEVELLAASANADSDAVKRRN